MIYILTGEIRTGKTSALLDWARNRMDVDGLICPDDENGNRYFLKIKSKETFPFEVENESRNEADIISIGPFQFLKSSFKKANTYLLDLSEIEKPTYLVIDELGKLELKNKGLHYSAKKLIPQYESSKTNHLIVIVRQSLCNLITSHYNINTYSILEKADLENLK